MEEHDIHQSSARAMAELLSLAFECDDAPLPEPPKELGEYRLLEKLGEGGMGTVYKALHTELDRLVAVKVIRPGRVEEEWAVERFRREIKAAGRLDHPNVVRAHDARKMGSSHFLVMEFVEGMDLNTLAGRLGPLAVADACELVRQAALGLQCVHEHGLVHRDIKPSNLMLGRNGQVKILDLGLARIHDVPAGQEMTTASQVMGTPDYIAPEQVNDSHGADIRADIYSLGCTLYRLLAGVPPFSGPGCQTAYEKMNAHLNRPAPPLRDCRHDVPKELAAVLDRVLAKSPSVRIATPGEVALSLSPFASGSDLGGLLTRAEGEPPSAGTALASGADTSAAAGLVKTPRIASPGAQPRPVFDGPRWNRRQAMIAALGLLTFVAVAIAGWHYFWRNGGEAGSGPQGGMTDAMPAVEMPAAKPLSPLSGWIVMSCGRPGLSRPHLCLFSPDGKRRIQLTGDPRYFDVQPKFSPDGRRIAFVRGTDPLAPNSVWVCGADGTGHRELIAARGKTERLASPVWVSNSRIYFVRDPKIDRSPDMEVWQIDVEGDREERVFQFARTFGKGSGLITDVSPDGRRLVAVAQVAALWPTANIYVCDLQGGGVQTVWSDQPDDKKDGRALWSRTGSRIAWHHNFSSGALQAATYFGVGVARLDERGQWTAELQPDGEACVTPLAWSPGGDLLLCARLEPPGKAPVRVGLLCLNDRLQPAGELFELEGAAWHAGQRDLGRVADWAVVPEDVETRLRQR